MLSVIVAVADNDVIGRADTLPWQLSRDLKNFKVLTTGHPVIMGYKTFQSIVSRIGKPLPNRLNIILSNVPGFVPPDDCVLADSIDTALKAVDDQEAFVIGGANVYAQMIPLADRLYLTRVHAQADGDIKLAPIDFSEWNLVKEEQWPKDEKNEFDATFQLYERKR
ncbi:dihydrofolate reductase [Candidatus Uhrbacteria bacterium]|jgi:dihydrofolate reductase|nr:dihydrofolate reductase [Candidatus Uhrbacteria bacterium]